MKYLTWTNLQNKIAKHFFIFYLIEQSQSTKIYIFLSISVTVNIRKIAWTPTSYSLGNSLKKKSVHFKSVICKKLKQQEEKLQFVPSILRWRNSSAKLQYFLFANAASSCQISL